MFVSVVFMMLYFYVASPPGGHVSGTVDDLRETRDPLSPFSVWEFLARWFVSLEQHLPPPFRVLFHSFYSVTLAQIIACSRDRVSLFPLLVVFSRFLFYCLGG